MEGKNDKKKMYQIMSKVLNFSQKSKIIGNSEMRKAYNDENKFIFNQVDLELDEKEYIEN